jgi:hypothetical protein
MKHLTEKQFKFLWWYRLPFSIVVMVALVIFCLWQLPVLIYVRMKPSVIWFTFGEMLSECWEEIQGPL